MGLMVGFMVIVVFLMPKLMENIGEVLDTKVFNSLKALLTVTSLDLALMDNSISTLIGAAYAMSFFNRVFSRI